VLYFFLSYARGGDDIYVRQFYKDLCDEVRAITGLGPDEEVGFLDSRTIVPGETWPDALVDALARCRSFLALCSPAYFLSEPCGKEWAIFAERVRRHQHRTGSAARGLIPLRWLPPRTGMPPAAQSIQYVEEPHPENQHTGDAPRDRGVRQLLRLQRNRDDYLDFVTTVAELIVDAANHAPAMAVAERQEFDAVTSAFHTTVAVNASAAGPAALPHREIGIPLSNKVYFVMSAPTLAEAADPAVGRRDRKFYGAESHQWTPYLPAADEHLARYATRIAHDRSFQAEIMDIGELDACITQAQAENQIVVLLVDPWSTKMNRHHRILNAYDQREDHPAAVMIPWSRDDTETQANAEELTEAIQRTFAKNINRPYSATFRSNVLNNDAFGNELHIVLEESRNRAIAIGTLRRPLPGSSGSRPFLEG
jgi:FxsC-like protein